MANKSIKGRLERIVDTITELVRQPLSDESNEVPTAAAVRKARAVAAGPKRRKVKKATAKKRETKKRTAMKHAVRKKKSRK
jgi:hypothetical protein